MYFLAFLGMVNVDLNTLFPLLQPPLERLGKVIFGQCPYDPLPLCLELVQGQNQAHQLPLQRWEQEEVCWCQVRTVQGVGKQLDLFFGQELLNFWAV
jgi:hypothetical protein